MQYRRLGASGLKVSRLTLGCMTYGVASEGHHDWTLGEDAARPLIKAALEAGINCFDTANGYSAGTSEEILGHALKDFARRDEVVVATKVYARTRDADKAVVGALGQVSERLGAPRSQVALAWLLQKPEVTSPIVGASKPQHLEDALAALALNLDAETVKALEAPYQPHPVAGFA